METTPTHEKVFLSTLSLTARMNESPQANGDGTCVPIRLLNTIQKLERCPRAIIVLMCISVLTTARRLADKGAARRQRQKPLSVHTAELSHKPHTLYLSSWIALWCGCCRFVITVRYLSLQIQIYPSLLIESRLLWLVNAHLFVF